MHDVLVELAAHGQLVRLHANASELFRSYFLKKSFVNSSTTDLLCEVTSAFPLISDTTQC